MNFIQVPMKFTLKDIGSEIIDQLSTDIYTGAGSIFRELMKNAYDAYLALDADDFEEVGTVRQIVISRERDGNGVGRILINDYGIGQSKDELKANVQISISRKPEELERATGFRGLGSWSVLGAGSRVTITTSKKGEKYENRLVINVREIYKILGPNTTLDDILNNSKCISFLQRGGVDAKTHFTTYEIECDGQPQKLNGHEFNRLYSCTDPADNTKLRRVIITSCQVPFKKGDGMYHKIHSLYTQVGYCPTAIILDGENLERTLPEGIENYRSEPLYVAGSAQPAAVFWAVDDSNVTGEIGRRIEDKNNLPGSSLQLLKYGVPIGTPGLHSDNVRAGILDWFIGEIHILSADVLPNASGDGLRDGTARDAFVSRMQMLYEMLEDEAETKSQRISLKRHMEKAEEAAAKISKGGLSNTQLPQEMAKVAKAVELLTVISKRGPAGTQSDERTRKAAKDENVASVIKRTKETLKKTGLMDQLISKTPSGGASTAKPGKTQKRGNRNGGRNSSSSLMTTAEFQALVARKIPDMQGLGLSNGQIEGIMSIIEDLFEAMID